ncbi:hypothetical protein NDU88_006249 [Pleurodeles waltl]|uniref:Uncharacterized protein n=1 Tax=Pleurodeles waltl TaxID=8319 RepID=A0AAV7SNZ8_PLEWA|nr:hypothetical protein NDU88_006249 [Pleurodeles waltl]
MHIFRSRGVYYMSDEWCIELEISYVESAGERRALLRDIEEAESNQRELERQCPKTPDLRASLKSARKNTIIAFDRLRCFDYRAFLTRTHAESDRTSSLLPWLGNPSKRGSVIDELTQPGGIHINSQSAINYEFRKYYVDLYTSKTHPPIEEIRAVLQYLPLPTMSAWDATELDTAITVTEVKEALIG